MIQHSGDLPTIGNTNRNFQKKKRKAGNARKKKLPNKTNMKSLHLMHEHIYTML